MKYRVLLSLPVLFGLAHCSLTEKKDESKGIDYDIPKLRLAIEKEFECLQAHDSDQERVKHFGACVDNKLPRLKALIEKNIGQTQCGEITGALKVGSEFHPFDYRHQHAIEYTRETREIEVYLMQYKPQGNDSVAEKDAYRYFYVSFPSKATAPSEGESHHHPVLLWGHGVTQENWNKMDGYLTYVPNEAIILKPLVKSEVPKNEQFKDISEAYHEVAGSHQYGDGYSLLSAADCMTKLNEMRSLPLMKANLEKSGVAKNPFYGSMRLTTYPNMQKKQVETHYFGNSLGALNGLKMLGLQGILNQMSEDKKYGIKPFFFESAFIATPQASSLFDELSFQIWTKAEELEKNAEKQKLGIVAMLADFLLAKVALVKAGSLTPEDAILDLVLTDAATNLHFLPHSFPKKQTDAAKLDCNLTVLYSRFDIFSNLNKDLPGLEKDEALRSFATYLQSKLGAHDPKKPAPTLVGTVREGIQKWKEKPENKTTSNKSVKYPDLVNGLTLPQCSDGTIVVANYDPVLMASTSLASWISQAFVTLGMNAYEGDIKEETSNPLSHLALFPYRNTFFSSPHLWDMGSITELHINGKPAESLADGFHKALNRDFKPFDESKLKMVPGKKIIAASHDFFNPQNNQHLKYPIGYLYEWLTLHMHIHHHVPQTSSVNILTSRIFNFFGTEGKSLCEVLGWSWKALEPAVGKGIIDSAKKTCQIP